MPELSQRPGAMKALWSKGLRGVATVTITFNNLNKKNDFRKTFLFRVATLTTKLTLFT
jgi:hypothetical protein